MNIKNVAVTGIVRIVAFDKMPVNPYPVCEFGDGYANSVLMESQGLLEGTISAKTPFSLHNGTITSNYVYY